ncbi:MAG: CPBP family intramembrane glutamic endopeptidase [Methanobacteriota archaeon]
MARGTTRNPWRMGTAVLVPFVVLAVLSALGRPMPGFALPDRTPVSIALTVLAPVAGLAIFVFDVTATSALSRWYRGREERRHAALSPWRGATPEGGGPLASPPAAPASAEPPVPGTGDPVPEASAEVSTRPPARGLRGARKILVQANLAAALFYVFAVVATEEAVRILVLDSLSRVSFVGIAGSLVAVNVVYGLFHSRYGAFAIPAKVVDGLAYSGLFLATGSLIAPILGHATFNLLIRRALSLPS